MYPWDPKLSVWLHELLLSKGVEVCTSHSLASVSDDGSVLNFHTAAGQMQHSADWVIVEPELIPSDLAAHGLLEGFDPKHLINKHGVHIVGTATKESFKVLSASSLDDMADSVSRQIISGRHASNVYEHVAQVRLPISTTAVRDLGLNAEGRVIFSNEHSGLGLFTDKLGDFASYRAKTFWNAVWN